jgi:Uncharacterized protein conserved in bacteria
MTLADLLLPTYRQMLAALSGWLDKAEGEHADAGALLSARLAPDMFPLATQIRFVCVQAYEGVARLKGEDFPPVVAELTEEGRNSGDAPGTLADARGRIAQTLAMLDAIDPGALAIDPDAAIEHSLPNGMTFDFTALQYVRDWALPQFQFHLITAYAILRAEGVPLGKVDYVSHLIGHLRPESLPAG